jgi:hypothetical protein
MELTHKIALDATLEQIAYFKQAAGTARFTYNYEVHPCTSPFGPCCARSNLLQANLVGTSRMASSIWARSKAECYGVKKTIQRH